MNKKDFDNLLMGVRQMKAMERGDLKPAVERVYTKSQVDALQKMAGEVKRVRSGLALTQRQFAKMMDVPIATLQGWEQGRRMPEGPARALLRVTAFSPKTVLKALGRKDHSKDRIGRAKPSRSTVAMRAER